MAIFRNRRLLDLKLALFCRDILLSFPVRSVPSLQSFVIFSEFFSSESVRLTLHESFRVVQHGLQTLFSLHGAEVPHSQVKLSFLVVVEE